MQNIFDVGQKFLNRSESCRAVRERHHWYNTAAIPIKKIEHRNHLISCKSSKYWQCIFSQTTISEFCARFALHEPRFCSYYIFIITSTFYMNRIRDGSGRGHFFCWNHRPRSIGSVYRSLQFRGEFSVQWDDSQITDENNNNLLFTYRRRKIKAR